MGETSEPKQMRFVLGDETWEADTLKRVSKGREAVMLALKGAGLSGRFWEAFDELHTLGYDAQQAAAGAFYVVGRKGRSGLPMEKLGLLIGRTRQWVHHQLKTDGPLYAEVMRMRGQYWADKIADLDERLYERTTKSNKVTAADFRLAYERAGVMGAERESGEDAHSALLKMLGAGERVES